MKKDLRIVFMGTPDFAVPSLKILVENGYNVVGVITAPDKPAGRGLKIQQSAVKQYAVSAELNILQPTKLKDPQFLEELAALNANLQIVVAFRMLPEVVWNAPEIGTFNLHGSLLPNYRGAAPINWAVINGEKKTGVTTFFLKHEIDTGDVLFQEEEPISNEDTAGDVYARLMEKGSQLVLKTVQMIESGDYKTAPQNYQEGVTPTAPKIFKDTCKIDWSKTSQEVYNLIRGMAPYPTAWTEINGKSCKVFKAKIASEACTDQVESDQKSYLRFKTADGAIDLLELQLQGKKRMDVESFLRGFKL